LHPDDQGVLSEFFGGGVVERQVRDALEDDGDLGDPSSQSLAGAQVERDAGPAPGVDVLPDRGERLGAGVR